MPDWHASTLRTLKQAFTGKQRWLLMLSGGGDSVALLRLALEAKGDKKLVLGHFNHRWSKWGNEAQAFVEKLAKKHKLPLVVGQGTGKAKTNAEATARSQRRAWMYDVLKEHSLHGALMAHTRTDQMETLLMRLGKGSGIHGLAGIKETLGIPGKRTHRPLLNVGREELRVYLKKLKQQWLEDPDNAKGGSQRAKIRKLLPALAEAGVTEEGAEASRQALGRANEALSQQLNSFWKEHTQRKTTGVNIDRLALLRCHEEIGQRVIEWALDYFTPAVVHPRLSKRLALLTRITSHNSGTSTLGTTKWSWQAASIQVQPLKTSKK